ncbi:DMT family transporter [Desulfosporosinus lacus]|uniref:Threonine/homoserine efflux transporter RhtA n=1 Tax=Desulfosporosinus lacus DSM 15449 TaxID=1121420 RepID=A0A1M5ZJL5_9FIRM|nr:DMT family transporter [Desulfosporosinus lacus]SHI24525.1 Threonine/homoserine efflux transporter RhtA [Desulfosporosinus lacus DSM 15449]
MKANNRNLAEIHLAVLLFGLSGLFAKLLPFSSVIIVLGRVFFSSIFLGGVILYLKKDIKLKEQKHYIYLVLMGAVLAFHWSTFFTSIQVSTVSIGLLTFSTFPVFVTFLEPLFFHEKLKLSNLTIAIVTFLGVMLVIPRFDLGNNLTQGVMWGMLSGLTYAVLSMLNRKFVKDYSSLVIAFYEQVTATIILIPFFVIQHPVFSSIEILLLLLLGVVFTGISHSLFINGLKTIKTQTAGVISCLEPVYGIIFTTLILREIPTIREVLGGLIILSAVFYSTTKTN